VLRAMPVIITLIVAVVSVSGYVEANDWTIRDIYGDAPRLLIQETDFIDLTFKKESSIPDYEDREKTLGSDFGEFIRETLSSYMFIWAGRTYLVPGNTKKLFTTPLPTYLKHIIGWQGCNGVKSRRGLCSPKRRPFWNPPLLDGDRFETNFIQHPIFGGAVYLYYRARGYDRTASSFGSFLQSTLFEYTTEGWQQPPSFNDLILTPGLGVPMGVVLEEASNWLAQRDSQVLRVLSYIVNPTRVFVPEGDVAWQNFLGRTIVFRFNW